MPIILFLICTAVFLAIVSAIFMVLFKDPRSREVFSTLKNGFQEGLQGSGLINSKVKYPVDLWVWETMDDEHVCEDCLDRSSWPPMDIADWMKEGLPRTPESCTECGENCRCQIIPYRPQKTKNRN